MGLFDKLFGDNKEDKNSFFGALKEAADKLKSEAEKAGIDLALVRLYELSLFLSMLPLHMDRPNKVFGFVLNALAILEEIKRRF